MGIPDRRASLPIERCPAVLLYFLPQSHSRNRLDTFSRGMVHHPWHLNLSRHGEEPYGPGHFPQAIQKRNRISQWAFDTRPILGRFHLWLEDVRETWIQENSGSGNTRPGYAGGISFTDDRTEKMLAMTSAVTALGTRLFGRYGEGKGLDKARLNLVKKDADAISAYAMSESLWYLSRTLPENHAIMVCLGEGLMPKAGETAEMGANPLLGFGRIYARPQVAKFLETCVYNLINEPDYSWIDFRRAIAKGDIRVWGAAIDTLENTSRFAKGEPTGPMSVLHLFDQPLTISDQYEGYMGCLVLPGKVVETAADRSVLVNYFTPRTMVMDAIVRTYPGIRPANVHVWTLTGEARQHRIGRLWEQWEAAGAHLVTEAWPLPTGIAPFTDSGTYAPTFAVKPWTEKDGQMHLLVVDGYAASAEAIQAASLSSILDLDVSLAVLSSKFKLPCHKDAAAMKLDPETDDFHRILARDFFGRNIEADLADIYKQSIVQARDAGIPLAPPDHLRIGPHCGETMADPGHLGVYAGRPLFRGPGGHPNLRGYLGGHRAHDLRDGGQADHFRPAPGRTSGTEQTGLFSPAQPFPQRRKL